MPSSSNTSTSTVTMPIPRAAKNFLFFGGLEGWRCSLWVAVQSTLSDVWRLCLQGLVFPNGPTL